MRRFCEPSHIYARAGHQYDHLPAYLPGRRACGQGSADQSHAD